MSLFFYFTSNACYCLIGLIVSNYLSSKITPDIYYSYLASRFKFVWIVLKYMGVYKKKKQLASVFTFLTILFLQQTTELQLITKQI